MSPLLQRQTNSAFGLFSPPLQTYTASYESIASTRITSSAAAITISSIPSTYKHLQIRWTGACGDDYMFFKTNIMPTRYLRMASYANANYNGGAGNTNATYGAEVHFGGIGSVGPATGIINILDYSDTNKVKIAHSVTGSGRNFGGDPQYSICNAYMFLLGTSTSAINSITIQANPSYPLIAGTTVSVYGIAG